MVEEEKFQAALFQQPWLIAIISLISLLSIGSLISLLRYLKREVRENRFSFNGVQAIAFSGTDLFSLILLLFLVAAAPQVRAFFYPVAIVGIIFVVHNAKLNPLQFWGFDRFSFFTLPFLSIWICLATIAVLMPLSFVVDWISGLFHLTVEPQKAVETLLNTKDKFEAFQILFAALALAPIAEELFFRGLLYPFFKSKMPVRNAVFLTSFVFALIHFHLFTFVQLFVLGLILNAIFEFTGSLPLCMGLHMSFNIFNAAWLLILKSQQ